MWIILGLPSNNFFQPELISWMVTLSLCLIWQIISFIFLLNEYGCDLRLNNAGKVCLRLAYRRSRFWQKNHLYRWSSFWSCWYVNKQNCHIWAPENLHTYIEKPTNAKRVTACCRFWSRDITGLFFFENKQGEAVTVNGDRCRAMLYEFLFSQKLKRRILATFDFNRTALCTTQPKLHSMFCALFFKIALSAAELMSFGHIGVAIWHRYTIICGVLFLKL